MMSVPNLLTLACVAAVGGVVAVGQTTIRGTGSHGVDSFLHGIRDGVTTVGSELLPGTLGPQVLGAAASKESAREFATRRLREIYEEAIARGEELEATEDEDESEADSRREIPLRASDFHHWRHKVNVRQALPTKDRTVFARSRRAGLLSAQGRAFPRAGSAGYYHGTRRDDRPISPTGRSTVFQRSRFHNTTESRYSYSSRGRVRRVPRPVRR